MKAPQERETPKRITDRDLGYPDLVFSPTREGFTLYERGDDRWPPEFRSREEVEALREWCDAWLAHDAAEADR